MTVKNVVGCRWREGGGKEWREGGKEWREGGEGVEGGGEGVEGGGGKECREGGGKGVQEVVQNPKHVNISNLHRCASLHVH